MKVCFPFRLGIAAAIALALVGEALPAQQIESQVPTNSFADVETVVLSNGLRVWLKVMPQDPNVSISVSIPYGSGDDPPGLEQLAHFLEHMLFSDHLGRTEEQVKAEIEDLGGYRNGTTYADHTYYVAQVEACHAEFATDWLYKLISPREMHPEIVERQRIPLIVEVKARSRDLFGWIKATYLEAPALRLQGWWEREFGISTHWGRDYYPYRSINRITPADLRWFYDTYYVPSRMTLMVAGNFDREAVLATIQGTFATLSSGAEPDPRPPLHDPGRPYRAYLWEDCADTRYARDIKLYGPRSCDQMFLHFIAEYIDRSLSRELRYGDQKAVYGLRVGVRLRGEAMTLYIYGRIKNEESAFAMDVIDREIRALREGTISEDAFASARNAIAAQWRSGSPSGRDLASWFQRYFYNPDRFGDFPDMVAFAEGLALDDVVQFSRENLLPERDTLSVTRPFPVKLEGLVAVAAFLLWLVFQISRRLLVMPVDMSRVRYVARFRVPLIIRLTGGLMLLLAAAVVGRLYAYVADRLYYDYLAKVDNFWFQYSIMGLIGALGFFLLIVALAHIPYKLMIFEDHIRIKYLFFRSKIIWRRDAVSLETLSIREILRKRRLRRCIVLTLGLFKPGLYLSLRNGHSLFFQVREAEEAIRSFSSLGFGTKPS